MKQWHLVVLSILVAVGTGACSQSDNPEKKEAAAGSSMESTSMPEKAATTAAPAAEMADKAAVEKTVERAATEAEQEMAQTTEQVKSEAVESAAAMKTEVTDATAPVATVAQLGDAAIGKKITKGKCGGCHALDTDRKKVGPTLKGIFGKKPTIEGIPYATWDAAALDAWIKRPKDVKPRTRMAFSGIDDAGKRQDIIAYLKTL